MPPTNPPAPAPNIPNPASAPTSANFSFFATHDVQFVRLGALAERYFRDDSNTSLIKVRQFGERLAQLVAANAGQYEATISRWYGGRPMDAA